MNDRTAIREQALKQARSHRIIPKNTENGYRWRWGTRWGDMYKSMRVGDVVTVRQHPGSTIKHWGRKLNRAFSSTKRGNTWVIRRMA